MQQFHFKVKGIRTCHNNRSTIAGKWLVRGNHALLVDDTATFPRTIISSPNRPFLSRFCCWFRSPEPLKSATAVDDCANVLRCSPVSQATVIFPASAGA